MQAREAVPYYLYALSSRLTCILFNNSCNSTRSYCTSTFSNERICNRGCKPLQNGHFCFSDIHFSVQFMWFSNRKVPKEYRFLLSLRNWSLPFTSLCVHYLVGMASILTTSSNRSVFLSISSCDTPYYLCLEYN